MKGQVESKWSLEASLKRQVESKLRLEASLEGQVESKFRLEATSIVLAGPEERPGRLGEP